MKDHYRIVAIADPHVGKDSWGVTGEKWDAPLNEGVDYAIEHDADLLIILGDLFHRRVPTPVEYLRAMTVLRRSPKLALLILDGNHDIGAASTSIPATWAIKGQVGQWCECHTGAVNVSYLGPDGFTDDDEEDDHGLDILVLPWPRLAQYDLYQGDSRLSLEQLINGARTTVLELLKVEANRKLHAGHFSLLVGHAMLSYGGNYEPSDPGMLLGKDIVLPVSELPKVDVALFGHVHQPDERYVGSTQPTDFADWRRKSFTVVDFELKPDGEGWKYTRKNVPYKTSLKVWDCVIRWTDEPSEIEIPETLKGLLAQAYRLYSGNVGLLDGPRFDVARCRIEVDEYHDADPAELRKLMEGYADRVVSVEVVRPQAQVRRLGGDDAPIVATMKPDEALEKWLDVTGKASEPSFRSRVLESFRALAATESTGSPQ